MEIGRGTEDVQAGSGQDGHAGASAGISVDQSFLEYQKDIEDYLKQVDKDFFKDLPLTQPSEYYKPEEDASKHSF